MKTISRIILAAVAVVSMAACAQEVENPTEKSNLALNEFGASSEVATKVTIDSDWMLSWEEGDEVDIYDGAVKTVFVAQNAGTSTILKASETEFAREESKVYYAVYPSSESIDGNLVTINVEGDRKAVANEYPAAPAVGVTLGEDAMFSFKNVCGLVSFVVEPDQNIASVVIFGGNGENIAGQIESDAQTAAYTLVEGTGVKEIRLTPSEGDVFAAGRYYVAVLPQKFSAGLSISFYKSNGERLRKNCKEFTLGRAMAIDIETGGEFKSEYTIKNADELVSFLALAPSCAANVKATLANDIDLAGVTLPKVSTFAGTFDGAGHSLKNWTTSEPLFTKIVAGATVAGVVLDASCTLNMKETDSKQAFIVGTNEGSVSGCTNKADITYSRPTDTPMQSRYFGTVVGYSTGLVENCHNEGNISITITKLTYDSASASGLTYQHQNVAGVVGAFDVASGTVGVEGCTNKGNITYDFQGVSTNDLRPFIALGGVCAIVAESGKAAKASEAVNHGTIKDCTNSGVVLLKMDGIVGSNYSNIGGVVGYIEGTVSGCLNQSTGKVRIELVNSSSVKVSAPAAGGVIGNALTGDVLNCSNAAPVEIFGYIQGGSSDAAYAGGSEIPAIGGVVAKAGAKTENTALKVKDCVNSGTVTLQVYNSSNICMGGIVGWTSLPLVGSDTNKLLNSGALVVKTGTTLKSCYLGGVVGYSISTYDKVYNTGEITVDLDNGTDNQVAYVAGIAGYMAKTLDATTAKQGINKGNLTVSGGNPNSTQRSYIAGVVARSMAYRISSNNTGWATCNSNYGNITVNSPLTLTIGGVLGELNAAVSSGKNGATERCKHQGTITVTSPGKNSYIGGVIGKHGRGQLGNANGFGESDTKLGKIIVTGADASTYVGGYFGYLYTDNGAGTTISGCGFRGEISAEGATAGVIAGYVGMTGKSCKNVIKLGTGSTERPKISKAFKLNGVVVGDFSLESVEESHYFGKIAPSTTSGNEVAGQYFFQAGGITGNLGSTVLL